MEGTVISIVVGIVIPILTAVIGGWVGAYFGMLYQRKKEDEKMQSVRSIAIKALDIIKKYSKKQYTEAESDFNTSLTIAEKRTVIVLLHKLGVPIVVDSEEAFNIHRIRFTEKIIDKEEIDGMILQVTQKHCDNLFFLDAETYFNTNRQLTALRNVGKKYVEQVLAKSIYDKETHQVSYPSNWVSSFGVGEYMALRILHEQACIDILYDNNGLANPEKIAKMLHEIDMGLWDYCLFGIYEMYKNAKSQVEVTNALKSIANTPQVIVPEEKKEKQKL